MKIPDFSGSQSVCLDFAVTHTLQTNYINRASVEAGAAAAGYEETVKEEKYADRRVQEKWFEICPNGDGSLRRVGATRVACPQVHL